MKLSHDTLHPELLQLLPQIHWFPINDVITRSLLMHPRVTPIQACTAVCVSVLTLRLPWRCYVCCLTVKNIYILFFFFLL